MLDIETENIGLDIMEDNRRIISIQLGDSRHQEVYYADSPRPERSLAQGIATIRSVVASGRVLAGYNIEKFDLPLLKRFCEVEIPKSGYLEIGTVNGLCANRKAQRKSARLEDICPDFGIPVSHKFLMGERAERIKARPDIISKAEAGARELVSSKGWSPAFALGWCLDKLAGGLAILEAYNEFVSLSGSADTLFHRYAVGDVVCEFLLLQALTPKVVPG